MPYLKCPRENTSVREQRFNFSITKIFDTNDKNYFQITINIIFWCIYFEKHSMHGTLNYDDFSMLLNPSTRPITFYCGIINNTNLQFLDPSPCLWCHRCKRYIFLRLKGHLHVQTSPVSTFPLYRAVVKVVINIGSLVHDHKYKS